jgi:hypothetical protein
VALENQQLSLEDNNPNYRQAYDINDATADVRTEELKKKLFHKNFSVPHVERRIIIMPI